MKVEGRTFISRTAIATLAVGVSLMTVGAVSPAGAAGAQRFIAYDFAQRVRQTLHDRAVARGLEPRTAQPRRPRSDKAAATATVTQVQQISHDSLPPFPNAEPDTQVEPDIAVSPIDPSVVVAVFQQSRFQLGASEDPGYAASRDGGITWVHGDLPHLTLAVGGLFERASDPAVTIGPYNQVYAQTLVVTFQGCHSGISFQRSHDGGRTFKDPVFPQNDLSCNVFNDKNWITVDNAHASPHLGRIYMTWDRTEAAGSDFIEPIVLRYSDDKGATWSKLINVSGSIRGIGVLPLVQPNGDLTLIYIDIDTGNLVAQTSHDGGVSFTPPNAFAADLATEPPDMRTGSGLQSAAVDPVTGRMYVVWQDTRFHSDGLNDIVISSSSDGQNWSSPARVNPDLPDSGLDHFTPGVGAYGGRVDVTYQTRNNANGPSRYVRERYIVSFNGGATFGGEVVLGPPADLKYAARVFHADVKFLGDYNAVASSPVAAYPVWCRSFAPPTPAKFHQTAWSSTIQF
jgi:hypothetical protein